MPEGINVELDGRGDARISFPDRTKKGPALAALIATGSPFEVRTGGARREYIVPEGNAREAGLIDDVRTDTAVVETHDHSVGEDADAQVSDATAADHKPDSELTHTTDGRANDSAETEATASEKETEATQTPEPKKAPAKKAPAKKVAPAAAKEAPNA